MGCQEVWDLDGEEMEHMECHEARQPGFDQELAAHAQLVVFLLVVVPLCLGRFSKSPGGLPVPVRELSGTTSLIAALLWCRG